jgi:hypothetical protein
MNFFKKKSKSRRIIKDQSRKDKILSVPMGGALFNRLKAKAARRNLATGAMVRELCHLYNGRWQCGTSYS